MTALHQFFGLLFGLFGIGTGFFGCFSGTESLAHVAENHDDKDDDQDEDAAADIG